MFEDMKEYATKYDVPIMEDEGIDFLLNILKENHCKSVLEIGTAIAYSAIRMASLSSDIHVVSIERDEERYHEAVRNVAKYNLEDQITLILGDALDVEIEGIYDFIFIDAAKAQYTKFFNKYTPLLSDDGVVLSDNLDFHGMVSHKDQALTRNVRQLVRKIQGYIDFLKDNEEFTTEFFDIGDGIAISKKVKKH